MPAKSVLILLLHALAGWVLCDATMGIGMAVTTLPTALIVHAVAAPIFFAGVSAVYFRRFHFTSPLATATVFLLFVMVVDFLFVALVVNRSLAMFQSALGTWIPFALIFASTWVTGSLIRREK